MLFEFRVYFKGVVYPSRYGFVTNDFNAADDQLRNQLAYDTENGNLYTVERVVFIEPECVI